MPIPGASIKLLSLERERGYAVLLGKLEPGSRYPAHVNVGPEDFYILTGDLMIGDCKTGGKRFPPCQCRARNMRGELFGRVKLRTLIAVLSTGDPLVNFCPGRDQPARLFKITPLAFG